MQCAFWKNSGTLMPLRALNHGSALEKVHQIQLRSLAEVRHWYECGTKKKSKNDFEKYFFKLMNNAIFGKFLERSKRP